MTRFRCSCTLLATLLSLPACGDDGSSSSSATGVTGVTGATTNTTNTTATTATSGASMSGGSVTDGTGSGSDTAATTGPADPTTGGGFPKLDVGVEETTDGGSTDGEKGCRKVDFLFIIDNSGSMQNEQQALIASFPGFISAIQDQLELASDYHIMVIDTDSWVFAGCDLICPFFGGLCPVASPTFACGDPPLECEDVLGAGVVHPRGMQASEKDCMFTSGGRYMTAFEPDLPGAFACAAKVGTGSTDDPEKPMEAMVQAVAPSGAAHDCNLGFIREDAILVVTFVTDEDDNAGDGSAGTPAGWKASLVAAKKGDENALVVLGLFGDNDQPNPICGAFDPNGGNGAEPSPRLRQFVDSFGDHGFSGSICAGSYDQFFTEAVAIIDSTCDEFVPPT